MRRYEAAGANDDLRLGDVHLLPLGGGMPGDAVALVVAQSRDRQGQLSSVQLGPLEAALVKISQHARRTHATVHLPRIGQRSPGFDWYRTERCIRKCLATRGVPTFVYYYLRRGAAPASAAPVDAASGPAAARAPVPRGGADGDVSSSVGAAGPGRGADRSSSTDSVTESATDSATTDVSDDGGTDVDVNDAIEDDGSVTDLDDNLGTEADALDRTLDVSATLDVTQSMAVDAPGTALDIVALFGDLPDADGPSDTADDDGTDVDSAAPAGRPTGRLSPAMLGESRTKAEEWVMSPPPLEHASACAADAASMSRGTPQPTSPQDISAACSHQPIVNRSFLRAQEHLDCKYIIGGISYSSCIGWCCL